MPYSRSTRLSVVLIGFATATTVPPPNVTAEIISVGGSAVLAEPPESILLGEWESDTEIRTWFEREVAITSDLTLGHVDSGFVDDIAQLVGGTVRSGTSVRSYMVRVDPIGNGPTSLNGFVVFDTPILGVFIGSQLGPTDPLLGRPGITYNANSFRGLEIDPPTGDAFEISADRLRIDFATSVDLWTDDIRIVTAVPEPLVGPFVLFGITVLSWRRR